jgi:hypothetical protein
VKQWYQEGLFANRRPSFSVRNLGSTVCAIVLIAVSSISWVPEGGCQSCKKEFVTESTAYTKCRNNLYLPEDAPCHRSKVKQNTVCANKLACEECKCMAVSARGTLVQGYTASCDVQGAGAALLAAFRNKKCCEK